MTEATAVTLREALRESTRPQHESIESAMKVSEWSKSKEGYRWLIGHWYGFIVPVEKGIWQHEEKLRAIFPDLDHRSKLLLLEKDLRNLGLDDNAIASLPLCENPPDLSTPEKAAGALYVMEGSTMGGMMITKYLQEEHGMGPDSGAAYYRAYGEETMPMWQQFCKGLADPSLEAQKDAVVQASKDTFTALEAWFRSGQAP